MADVKDILGLGNAPRSGTPVEGKELKPKKEKMQRPAGMSREAFALLGDQHPIISTQLVGSLKKKELKTKPKPSTKGITTWQYKSFRNSAREDGLELLRWTKCYKDANGRMKEPEEGKEDYYFAKYNKKVQMFKYDDEEYDSLIKADSGDWSRQETDYLFQMCEQFDLRFPVIVDRYEFPGSPPRSMEDLKERYYGIARKLLVAREGSEAVVANQPLVKFPYNKQHESERKHALHLLLTRTAKQMQEDNAILSEAKQIEERRRGESAGRRPSAAVAAAARPLQVPAAAPARATSTGGSGATGAAAGAGSGGLSAAPSAGAPRASPAPPFPQEDLKFPADFPADPGRGVPSLFDVSVQPYKPPKPGAYMRSANASANAAAMASAMAGGARAFKAVEQTLTDLGWGPAVSGLRMHTRPLCGGWLALRAEVVALHELRRNLQNRTYADDRKKGRKK